MSVLRSTLLWASKNSYLCGKLAKKKFVRRAVKKFMPGETVEDAIQTALRYSSYGIKNIFTHLGENIGNLAEAAKVTGHYLDVIQKIAATDLRISISIKLTQIGFELSEQEAVKNVETILKSAADHHNFIWIDMEDSSYTDRTIEFYRAIKSRFAHTGICLQAYLYRTESDIKKLLPVKPHIRLVKGAYLESHDIAFPKRRAVDENYFRLAKWMLEELKNLALMPVFATHDEILLRRIAEYGSGTGIKSEAIQINMLYGIKPALQKILAAQGFDMRVLISYGESWFPWYMRRLAERPANLGFVLRNMFGK